MRKLLALIVLACAGRAACGAEVILATYYDYAPWTYANQPDKGHNAELARLLTKLAGGKYEFVARLIPRKRIDVMLAQNEAPMVVAWVAPRFFGDEARTQYLWSPALMEDESLIVSSVETPLEYDGLPSLVGKRFSATFGHIYTDIDPLVSAGKITRSDGPNMESAIGKLLMHRDVDFGVIDRSALNALQQEDAAKLQRLYIARKPRTAQYTRHILIPKTQPELAEFLGQAIKQIAKTRQW